MKIRMNFLGSRITKKVKNYLFILISLFISFAQISKAESVGKNTETVTVDSLWLCNVFTAALV